MSCLLPAISQCWSFFMQIEVFIYLLRHTVEHLVWVLAAKAPSPHGSIETIMFQLLGLHEEDTGNCLDDRIAGGVVPGRSTRVCRHAATVIDSSARACRRAAVETSGRRRACGHWATLTDGSTRVCERPWRPAGNSGCAQARAPAHEDRLQRASSTMPWADGQAATRKGRSSRCARWPGARFILRRIGTRRTSAAAGAWRRLAKDGLALDNDIGALILEIWENCHPRRGSKEGGLRIGVRELQTLA